MNSKQRRKAKRKALREGKPWPPEPKFRWCPHDEVLAKAYKEKRVSHIQPTIQGSKGMRNTMLLAALVGLSTPGADVFVDPNLRDLVKR